MKILKIFGIVVGIHLFALILIFANPGCSSTSTKPASASDSTAASTGTPSGSTAGTSAMVPAMTPAGTDSAPTSSAITFNPDTPAAPAPAGSSGVRFSPTRPNSAVAGALVNEPVADVTPATTYTVKAGDNLWTIARKNNTTLAQLTAANNLSANASLKPGQKLIIPSKSASAATLTTPSAGRTGASASAPASDQMKHVVKSGETLGGIARRYGVRQGELAVANNISDPARIRPGMELVIPGWNAAGAKAGKNGKSSNGAGTPPPASAPSTFEPLPPPEQTPPSNPPPVPVIRIDDSSNAPAPKL